MKNSEYMSDQEKTFFNEFRKKFIQQVIYIFLVGMIAIVGTSVGFYYNTQNDISRLQEQHQSMRNRQMYYETTLQRKVEKDDYVREIDEVKALLRDINRKIDNIK
jgi:hypothetical protein